jgi:hypothetical protein
LNIKAFSPECQTRAARPLRKKFPGSEQERRLAISQKEERMTVPKMQTVDQVPTPTQATPEAAKPDPLSLDNLKLSQDFLQTGGTKKLLTKVPLIKPPPQSFFRVHPDPAFRGEFAVLQLKDENETYLVTSAMMDELMGEVAPVTIYTCMTKQGVLFCWPVRLPGPDGRDNSYWKSAREAADHAMGQWIRIKANQYLKAYEVYLPDNKNLAEPKWPDLDFQGIIRLAGKDSLLDSADHHAVKVIRGVV